MQTASDARSMRRRRIRVEGLPLLLLRAGLMILHHLIVHLLPAMIHALLVGMGRRSLRGRGRRLGESGAGGEG